MEKIFVRHLEGMTGGRDLTGLEGVTDIYPLVALVGLMKLSRRNMLEPYLGVWPMMADQCGGQSDARCVMTALKAAALELTSTSASNVESWTRMAMQAAETVNWIAFIPSAAALTTSGDEFNQRQSGGACAANRRCLACSRGRDWKLAWELPTVARWRRRHHALGAGQIRCTARTPWTVVARRDHLLPRSTVLMVMIVAGTSFRGQLTAARTFADWDRRSMGLGGRTLCADEVAHPSREGRAS